jgi:hypothetical protein
MERKRYYTVVEANEAIATIEPLVRCLTRRAECLARMRPGAGTGGRPAPDTPVSAAYFRELLGLHEELRELGSHGCQIKDLRGGVVDFPALYDGREVFLCWRLGESEVSYWHEQDAGFRGRQPILSREDFRRPS